MKPIYSTHSDHDKAIPTDFSLKRKTLNVFASFMTFILQPAVSLVTPYLWVSLRDREYFYTLLGESIKSDFTYADVFDQIQAEDTQGKLAQLASMGRRGQSQLGDFTAYLGEANLLPPEDIELLRIGVERDSLPVILDYLLTQNMHTISFDRHFLSEGKQYLLGVPLGVMAVLFAGDLFVNLRSISVNDNSMIFVVGGQHLFFWVYDWLKVWSTTFFVVTILFLSLHRLALPHVGAWRQSVYGLNIFKLYDEAWELKLTRMCAVLVPTGLHNGALMSQLARITKTNRRLYLQIIRAQRIAAEKPLFELLSVFISSPTLAMAKAKAPNQIPEEIAEGFAMANRINYLSHERNVRFAVSLLSLILMMISMIFIMPLVALASGI